MSFEFRYSKTSGKWQTVETQMVPSGATTRTVIGNGKIAQGLELASLSAINYQNVFFYEKNGGKIYSTKVSADLQAIIPYPLVFPGSPLDPEIYSVVVPFYTLKTSQSAGRDPTTGSARVNYLLGYRAGSGKVDIIEIATLTVKPFGSFVKGAKKIEALPLLAKRGTSDRDFVYFLVATNNTVDIYLYVDPFTTTDVPEVIHVRTYNISNVGTLSTTFEKLPTASRMAHQDFSSTGYFVLSQPNGVLSIKINAATNQASDPQQHLQHLNNPALVGSFAYKNLTSQTNSHVSLDDKPTKQTHIYNTFAVGAKPLEFRLVASSPTGFDEEDVVAVHISKFVGPNTAQRNKLVRGLIEASEIEHILMIQYLYAAMSFKTRPEEFTGARKHIQFEMVRTWKKQIMLIASEEMRHLAYTQGLLTSVSGCSHLLRSELPNSSDYFEGNTLMTLQRFNLTSLRRFIEFEKPINDENHEKYIKEAMGAPFDLEFDDENPVERRSFDPVSPPDLKYGGVGQLYRSLEGLITDNMLISTNEPMLNVSNIRLLRRRLEASNLNYYFPTNAETFKQIIEQIIYEGEGFEDTHDKHSHYNRFLKILQEYSNERRIDPNFQPARNVVCNPNLFTSKGVTAKHAQNGVDLFDPSKQTIIMTDKSPAQAELNPLLGKHEVPAKIVDLINVAYETMLTWLTQVFSSSGPKNEFEAASTLTFFPFMSEVIMPLADLVTEIDIDYVSKEKGKKHGDVYPKSVAFGPSFDISEAAHLIAIDRTASFVQLERFYSMKKMTEDISSKINDSTVSDPAKRARILKNLEYVAESLRVAALEFEFRTIHPKWPAELYMPHTDLDPFSQKIKDELSEHCEFTNVVPNLTGPGKKYPLVVEKLANFEKSFHGLKLPFRGWVNVRLATDPDWSFHDVGCSGNSNAYCSELIKQPPVTLDRVLRFNLDANNPDENKYLRSHGQPISVQVYGAQQFSGPDTQPTPVPVLEGAEVNLLSDGDHGPIYVGRNYLVAYDGEPVHPFIISVNKPGFPELKRVVKKKGNSYESLESMSSFERSLLGRWPYDIAARMPDKDGNEANLDEINAYGLFPTKPNGSKFKTAVEYVNYKLNQMKLERDAIADKNSAEYASLDYRIKDIQSSMTNENGDLAPPASSLFPFPSKWMRYFFFCNYCHHVSGPLAELSLPGGLGELDTAARWIVKYDCYVYDSDSLSHFIRGDIYIPTKKAKVANKLPTISIPQNPEPATISSIEAPVTVAPRTPPPVASSSSSSSSASSSTSASPSKSAETPPSPSVPKSTSPRFNKVADRWPPK